MNAADRTQIENLIFRYARYVDTAQWEDLGRLFAAAQVTANKTDLKLVGAEAVRDYWKSINRQYENGTLCTHHVVTNLEMEEISGGEVSVRSCFTVFQATPKLPLQPIACGRYQDRFDKAEGVWRFRSKHIEVTLVGEMREHLNISLS
jgi:3-phenylpropionate/cinnamic acid dioxygenase small subunit